MRIVQGKEREEVFEKFKNETKEKAFKLETLQYYMEGIDYKPSLKKWMLGQKEESLNLLKQNAKEMASWWPKDHLKKTRIHIVEYPLTEYLKWEIEAYKFINIPFCGEEVYLLDSKEIPDYKENPEGWVFDDDRAIVVNYDRNGIVLEFEIYEGEEVEPFLELRERILGLPLKKLQ